MLSGNHSPSFTKIKTPFCSWIFQFSHLPRGSELQAIEVFGPDQRKLLSTFFFVRASRRICPTNWLASLCSKVLIMSSHCGVLKNIYIYTYVYAYVYIYIYVYIDICKILVKLCQYAWRHNLKSLHALLAHQKTPDYPRHTDRSTMVQPCLTQTMASGAKGCVVTIRLVAPPCPSQNSARNSWDHRSTYHVYIYIYT